MTKAQKENQARFKRVQAEAKKLKAKNPKLKHIDAVKQAWAIVLPGSGQKKAPAKKTVSKRATRPAGYQYGPTTSEYDKRKQALKPGKRISKETGKPYYEYRANRSDKGKLTGVIDYTKLYDRFQKLENQNYHTEAILLLAYVLGTKTDQKIAQKLYDDLEKYGYSLSTNQKKQNSLSKKLYTKLMQGYKKELGIGAVKKKTPVKKTPAKSYHKDTQSHNVNIKVMSGITSKKTLIDLNLVGMELYRLENLINSLKQQKKQAKLVGEKKQIQSEISVYDKQFKGLRVYLNTRARFVSKYGNKF
jgi:hypothetical protein